jgi:hypothetical protein
MVEIAKKLNAKVQGDDGETYIGAGSKNYLPSPEAGCTRAIVPAAEVLAFTSPPGRSYPYIMQPDLWGRTQSRDLLQRGVDVKSGEVVTLELRIE